MFTTLANGTLVIFTKMAHHRKSEFIDDEDLWSRQVLISICLTNAISELGEAQKQIDVKIDLVHIPSPSG